MTGDVVVQGSRDVRGSLDGRAAVTACVVACPPHPQAGGSRSHPLLRVLGEELADRGVATLRFDYGPWDEGVGEVTDAERAVAWAADQFQTVGLFGYSFGASVALAAAADASVVGVAAVSPAHRLPSIDTVTALERAAVPVQLLYGERDRTVDSVPVADRARELGHLVAALPADHHFVGQHRAVAERVADFFEPLFA